MTSISDAPGLSIPDACGEWSETKAGYRHIGNDAFEVEKVQIAHRAETIMRASAHERVLAVQDTTFLNFSGHEKTTGLGQIRTKEASDSKGLITHTQFLITTQGIPLGILGQKIWSRTKREKATASAQRQLQRKTPIKDKESYKWIEFLEAKWVKEIEAKVVHIGDREIDMFEFIQRANSLDEDFVIRSSWNRRIKDVEAEHLLEKLKKQKVSYKTKIALEKQERGLEVRSCKVEIKLPGNHKFISQKANEIVTAIYVTEKKPPKGETALEWMLLTNIPCENNQEIQEKIEWYKLRWKIEVFHKILKTGCRVEKSRFSTGEKISKMVVLQSIVAWRLFFLSMLNKDSPNSSSEEILSEAEWKSLYCVANKTKELPQKAPTVGQSILWIAKLGGFLARRHDGDPGFITIWRGWNKLQNMALLWRSLNNCG